MRIPVARHLHRGVIEDYKGSFFAFFAIAGHFTFRAEVETGYPAAELDAWEKQVKAWARRGDAYVYVIAGAKERAPAAAQALIGRCSG